MTDEAWINTVRLARDFGTVTELLPEPFKDVRDMPHTLFDAIRQATLFIGFEQLADEDRPPRRIWQDPAAMSDHFAHVKKRHAGENATPDIDDPTQNELTRGLR